MTPAHVAVIDIGKTNAKLALVDMSDLSEIAVTTRANAVLPGPPWPHFDIEGIWGFLLGALADFHRSHGIDAISVTTHGASAVLLAGDGSLAAPMLDYEHPGPDDLASEYDALRPDFAETGSPRLGMGLNVGAQLHWQFATDPGLRDRVHRIVTYPQFWGFRLTGEAATDVTSLGCHTDLWNPGQGAFSALVDGLGIAELLAAPRKPGDILGPILPEIATRTGLAPDAPVLCGIHDSNASLLPHVLANSPPFSVVSTGTWVIAMSVGGRPVTLDPARDMLINVNALGDPVPSARFMGGREFTLSGAGDCPTPTEAEFSDLLRSGVLLLPALEPGSGPFRGQSARWIGPEPDGAARAAAVACYLALVTDTCLGQTGHDGPILVEGPFAANRPYLRMLAAATGSPVHVSGGVTGTSQGAALLWNAARKPATHPQVIDPAADPLVGDMQAYRDLWHSHL